MKLNYKPKRRDRSTGQSPYARHSKAPYVYSAAYRDWFSRNRVGGAKKAAS